MEDPKFCRVCLITNVKMYSLSTTSNNSVGTIYSQLTELPINKTDQHVCFECASLLYKYHNFKAKCHRAHNILSSINTTRLTKEDLKYIDRKSNNLASHLATSVYVHTSDHSCEDPVSNSFENTLIEEEIDIKIEENLSDVDDDEKVFNDIQNSEEDVTDREGDPLFVSKSEISRVKKRKRTTKINKADAKDIVMKKKGGRSTDDIISQPKENVTLEDHITVEWLTPEDAIKELLAKKDSSNYLKLPFKCEMCYKAYGVKVAFENHMKKHSVEYGDLECEFCHLRFLQKNVLYKHKYSSHQRKFSCKSCTFFTYCITKAKSHINVHKGKTYRCEVCSDVFSKLNTLVSHRRNKHSKLSECESVCEHCGCTFATPRGLFLHNVLLHRQDKNGKEGPECQDCNVHFASEAAWKRHLVLSSKHQVSNGCEYCGETFSDPTELKAHAKVHSRSHITKEGTIKIPTACPHCEKWLASRSVYNIHMTSQHPHTDEAKRVTAQNQTPFVCVVCGQAFKLRSQLRYHQRRHTGERPFVCNACGRGFPLATALAAHRAQHARRTHACHICSRTFSIPYALKRHIKAHLGIRPYKCNLCDKSFIHRCDLRLHIKCVHDKMPRPKKNSKRNSEDETTNVEY